VANAMDDVADDVRLGRSVGLEPTIFASDTLLRIYRTWVSPCEFGEIIGEQPAKAGTPAQVGVPPLGVKP